jgi:peptide deformylase|tara:strand:+ start:70 stop:513 length:444 start_codon:yes stop_codon:yes gene_type:complete
VEWLIITDKQRLEKQTKPCLTITEGLMIGQELLNTLATSNDGVGLAANQIGLNKSVCVVNVNKPIILVNPKITGKFGKSLFQEGCLSFPGDYIITERWTDIVVTASNHKEQMIFSFDKNALECVCVQHEIDHLNGITMYDRKSKMEL